MSEPESTEESGRGCLGTDGLSMVEVVERIQALPGEAWGM